MLAGLCLSGRRRARSSVSHISRNLRYIAGTMPCNFSINGDDFWALCGAWLASEGSVYGRTRNRKQPGQVTDGMVAAVMHPAQLFLLFEGEFGLLPPKFSFRAGNGHSLTGAHADQVGFELGEGGKDVEKHFAHRCHFQKTIARNVRSCLHLPFAEPHRGLSCQF